MFKSALLVSLIILLNILGSKRVYAAGTIYQLGNGVTGTLAADGTFTVKGSGPTYDYASDSSPLCNNDSIKKVIVEEGVTYIGAYIFEKCYGITQVDIAGSVKTVGREAFIWDRGIKKVILREGVEKLSIFCFGHCAGLEMVEFSQSIKEIDAAAFYACFSLREVILPNGLERIGSSAFGGCVLLSKFEIPSSVRQLDMSVFGACHNIMEGKEYQLKNVYVAAGNPYYQSHDGVVYTKDGKKIVWYPEGRKDSSYVVREGVDTVGEYAMSNEYLDTIFLPDSVTVISQYAFNSAVRLRNLNLPENLTEIGACAFATCWQLDNVVVPKSVARLGYNAFAYCINMHDITILNRNIHIGHATINGGTISDYIFSGCPADLKVHTSEGSSVDLYMNQYTTGNRVYDLQSVLGDVNDDGIVDAKDKKVLYNYIAGGIRLTGNQFQAVTSTVTA